MLGGVRLGALWPVLRAAGEEVPAPVPRFGHGAEVVLPSGLTVLGCFHVSQQNTFTGRLTEAMLDGVLLRARELAGLRRSQRVGAGPRGVRRQSGRLPEGAERVKVPVPASSRRLSGFSCSQSVRTQSYLASALGRTAHRSSPTGGG